MRIKLNRKNTFLPDKRYEIIAVWCNVNYLIQDDELEFIWVESDFFDYSTVEGKDTLLMEKVNESSHCLVPLHLNKKNRNYKNKLDWNLKPSELFEEILFLQNLKSNGYKLSQNKEILVSSLELQYSIIQQQIRSLGSTVTLLSDGYFPSIISITKIGRENVINDEFDSFIRSYNKPEVREDLKYEVQPIEDTHECLNDVFNWSYKWLKTFHVCSKILEDSYWNNQLLRMINSASNNLFLFAEFHSQKVTKGFFEQGDGSEVTMIKLESKDYKTILRIDNVVH